MRLQWLAFLLHSAFHTLAAAPGSLDESNQHPLGSTDGAVADERPIAMQSQGLPSYLQPKCAVCEGMGRMASASLQEPFVASIDILPDSVEAACQAHEPLRQASEGGLSTETGEQTVIKVTLRKAPLDARLGIQFTASNHDVRIELVRTPKCEASSQPGLARLADTEWIDLDVLKQWVGTCVTDHGEACTSNSFSPGRGLQRPAYLVDALEGRLIDTSTLQDDPLLYITLSYVRGGPGNRGHLYTTKENLARLQTPGALVDPELVPGMRPTFRDALELVRLLDYRYIWIPALCVIQDDGPNQAAEAAKMRDILVGGVFAINQVWDVDGTQGIRGIRELTNPQPRNFKQNLYPWREETSLKQFTENGVWHRGIAREAGLDEQKWSLPEAFLPRRQLRFYFDSVEWRCNTCWSREEAAGCCDTNHGHLPSIASAFPNHPDHDGLPRPRKRRTHWTDAFALPWFSVDHYFQSIRYLAVLDRSGSGDILDAAAGLISTVGSRSQKPFICGMPEEQLDIALLFAGLSDLSTGPERRRVGPQSQPDLPWPSWSWAGWITGGVVLDPVAAGGDYLQPNQDGDIIPIVEWYASESSDPDAPRRRLETRTWDSAKQRFQHSTREPVPPGWTREQNPVIRAFPRSRSRNEGDAAFDDSLVYKHESAPEIQFAYPVPMPAPGSEPAAVTPSKQMTTERFLYGKADRASVYIHFRDYKSYYLNQPYKLWDESGRHIGVLQSTAWDDLTRLFNITVLPPFRSRPLMAQNTSDLPSQDTRVMLEIVAISKTCGRWGYSDLPAMKPDGVIRYSENDSSNYFNVMWIEWTDGVAHRKGLGRVVAEYWALLKVETIDLVLG